MPVADKGMSPYEYLRSQFEKTSNVPQRRRPVYQKTRKKHLAWHALQAWPTGVEHFVALNVPACLSTMRVSRTILNRIFQDLPDAMAGPWGWTSPQMLRLCLSLTRPFHTTKHGHLLNVRNATSGSGGVWENPLKLRDPSGLIDHLVGSVLSYEEKISHLLRIGVSRRVAARQCLSEQTRHEMESTIENAQVNLLFDLIFTRTLSAPLHCRYTALMVPTACRQPDWPAKVSSLCMTCCSIFAGKI